MTALGINNSGELTMTYGKEDIDYKTDGDPNSGYIFNAAESVFWRRIRELMYSDLVNMYQILDSSGCWSSDSLINQWDNWQGQFPEEIWRIDIERKYYRTYQGGGLNGGATPEPTDRFLVQMMNGRKKYQRRQFERDQSAYMGTKYLSTTIKSDQIMFRCNTPQSAVVAPDYTLHIVPYSDMYLSVLFGNSASAAQIRAKAGQEYEIECPFTTMDDTAVLIYCASRIQALNDISACYIHDNDFSKASKLQQLIIGSNVEGYSNSFLTTLNLGNNALLEELDIRNCPNLTGSINLSSCNNLETLLAEGTAITGVLFASNGKIQSAHLPDTINSLTMRNLNYLTDLQVSYDNLESLTEENSIVDEYAIVVDAVDTLQTLRLVGIDWTLADTTLLNQILAMNNTMLSGKVYISGQIRNQELTNYANAWNDLEVTYNPDNLVTQYPVTYVNADDKTTVLFTVYVDRGATPPDPYAEGLIAKPVKESDAKYSYSFGTEVDGVYQEGSGWDEIESAVLAPRTVTAVYTESIREYTVTWYSRVGISLGSKKVPYGSEVVYDGEIPTRTDEESTYVFNLFKGWDKSTGYITGDVDVYAVWDRGEYPAIGTELADMSPAQIYGLTVRNNYSSPNSPNNIMSNYCTAKDRINITVGKDYSFSNVEEHTLVEVGNDLVLDGTDATVKEFNYKLFDEEDKGMTMVIDYEFTNTSPDGTLFSCFDFDGFKGVRLRYSSGSNLQWGNTNVACGKGRQRNVVVIRRQPNSKVLYYYYFNLNSDANNGINSFSDSIISTQTSRTTELTTNANVVLGAIKYLDTGTYDYHGEGVIHFCKIWNGDLGDTVAKDLASWYRETWTFEYIDTGLFRLASSNSYYTNASFICAHTLRYQMQMNTTNTNKDGWDACKMRKWLNPTYNLYSENHEKEYDGYNRVYGAFPIEWQQLIKRIRVPANHGNNDQTVVTSYDHIYLPSIKEMNNQTGLYVDEGTYITWFTSNATRIKFRGRLIPEDAQYITSNTEPTSAGYECKPGDVWINSANNSIGYIFVSDEEIEKYKMATSGDTNLPSNLTLYATADGGGWVSASTYWGRSAFVSSTTAFYYVYANGAANNGNTANAWYAVCPCFSI